MENNVAHRDGLEIIYEDNHLIAVNKKSGQLVQGDKTGDRSLIDLLKQYIKVEYDKPGNVYLGCIHRLDRPVTGVCIFAKTSKALERMNKLFSSRLIEKTYLAVVEGYHSEHQGTLQHYLWKDTKKNKTRTVKEGTSGAKHAVLDYQTLASQKHMSLFKVLPLTGRSHQIRVQLAKINAIIVGDLKYGYKKANKDASICLHCRSLEFIHPIQKKNIKITAKVPSLEPWNNFEVYYSE